MVTVVNKVPHPSVVKNVVCGNCGCELQYVPNDIKENHRTDYTGCRDYFRYIKCPECKNEVIVK